MKFIQVSTTFSSSVAAKALAERLVEDRRVACAQLQGPISSVFWWQGNLEIAEEWRLLMKTRADLFDAVAEAITSAHEYEVPQIVATELVFISPAYEAWLNEQLPF